MRHVRTRCVHCQAPYTYLASGRGGREAHTDGKYCPACHKTIHGALKGIPVRFKSRWVPISEVPQVQEVTLEQILEWERLDHEERPVGPRRIWPGLFDLESGDNFSIRGVSGRGPYRGILFQVGTWRLKEDHEIKVEMEFEGRRATGRFWSLSVHR